MNKRNEIKKAIEILENRLTNYYINKELGIVEKMTKEGKEENEAIAILLKEFKRLQLKKELIL